MPRYRLFGDTVQVASLLNATGEGIIVNLYRCSSNHLSFSNEDSRKHGNENPLRLGWRIFPGAQRIAGHRGLVNYVTWSV